jgi:hypothetical protein
MKLAILAALLAASTLAALAQEKVGVLTSFYRKDHVELEDKQGQVVLWLDSWATLHSPEFVIQQQNYNARLSGQFRGLIPGGLSAPEGIQLVPPQPPGLRGIQSSGVFAVPYDVPENGVLTRDTLSIPFFDLGIQWNYLARGLASDCEVASRSASAINCRSYSIGWRTLPGEIRAPADNDRLLLGLRYVELLKGLAALRRLQILLEGVVTFSAEGARDDAADDRQQYDRRNLECLQWSLMNTCVLADAGSLRFPFDWLTAQVDPTQLSPEFLRALHQAEHDAQLSITLAADEEELSRGRL